MTDNAAVGEKNILNDDKIKELKNVLLSREHFEKKKRKKKHEKNEATELAKQFRISGAARRRFFQTKCYASRRDK